MNEAASPIKAVVNDSGKQCAACGARPRYPHTLGCTVAYPEHQWWSNWPAHT